MMWYFPGKFCALMLYSAALGLVTASQPSIAQQHPTFLGMDRNDYPGDANMQALRKTFRVHRILAEQSAWRGTKHVGREAQSLGSDGLRLPVALQWT